MSPEQATLALEIRLYIDSLPKRSEGAIQRITALRRMAVLDKTLDKKATELESRYKEHLTAQGRFGRRLIEIGASRRKLEPNQLPTEEVKTQNRKWILSSLSGLPGPEAGASNRRWRSQ